MENLGKKDDKGRDILKMNIGEIIRARIGMDHILSMSGIDRKKVYWMGRNREELLYHCKIWEKTRLRIGEAHAVFVDNRKYIPFEKYLEFKEEIMGIFSAPFDHDSYLSMALKIFGKYEGAMSINKNNPKAAIMPEKFDEFDKALTKEAEENFNSIEIPIKIIEIDPSINNALKALQGELQLALEFMFCEASVLVNGPNLHLLS